MTMYAAALLASALCTAADAPIPIRDAETVVFIGDSITEQNHYTSIIETWLITRLPAKRLVFHNEGWAGDNAPGGNGRWERDGMPLKPTLVFVDFGMNDGAYTEFGDWILDSYLPPQRALAAKIKAGGAREVLLTPSCIDYHEGQCCYARYNETLGRIADAVVGLGGELGIPAVDIFHPMLEVLKRFKEKRPEDTFTPDSIHPNAMGGLVMAWSVLKRLDAPGTVMEITVPAKKAAAGFTVAPPCLPVFVPKDARPVLAFCSFENDVNRFRLTVPDWPADRACYLAVDGRPVAKTTAAELAAGLDLALLDDAPWSRRGEAILRLAEYRHQVHLEAWRSSGIEAPVPARDLAGFEAARAARETFIAQIADRLREMAQPGSWKVKLSTEPVLGIGKNQTRLIEGWEDPDADHGFAWDNSVIAGTTKENHTEGTTAGTLSFDLSGYPWPGIFAGFAYPQDFGKARAFAVDILAPAGSKLDVSLEITAGEKKKKEAKTSATRPVRPGKWTTIEFDLKDPDHALAAARNWSLVFTGTPTGRVTVLLDNFRVVR